MKPPVCISAFTDRDRGAVARHLVPALRGWGGHLGFVPCAADIKWQTEDDPDFDPNLMLVARAEEQIMGLVLGIRRPWKEGKEAHGFVKCLVVSPRARVHAVGAQLLDALEQRFLAEGCRRLVFGSAAPRYFFPGVCQGEVWLQRQLEASRWQRKAERVSLSLDLTGFFGAEDSSPKTKIDFTSQEQWPGAAAFIEREFSLSWAKEANPWLRASESAFCLRAMEDNAVVGFAAAGCSNRNWLGPMGVASSHRGQGLGTSLARVAALRAQTRGIESLMLPWVNDKETFYRQTFEGLRRHLYVPYTKDLSPT